MDIFEAAWGLPSGIAMAGIRFYDVISHPMTIGLTVLLVGQLIAFIKVFWVMHGRVTSLDTRMKNIERLKPGAALEGVRSRLHSLEQTLPMVIEAMREATNTLNAAGGRLAVLESQRQDIQQDLERGTAKMDAMSRNIQEMDHSVVKLSADIRTLLANAEIFKCPIRDDENDRD